MNASGIDPNGFIINEVSLAKIASSFKSIVDSVVDSILREFKDDLDGIYLYGSIVTGKAVAGKSDLDCILIFKSAPDSELRKRVKILDEALSKKFSSVLRGIGLEVTNKSDVCSEKERYGGLCFLKHLCVCIYGNDLSAGVPAFKPTEKVAYGFNGDIGAQLPRWRDKISAANPDIELLNISKSAAKKIVRTGFSLVMPRSKSWTTDLQTSYETFAKPSG